MMRRRLMSRLLLALQCLLFVAVLAPLANAEVGLRVEMDEVEDSAEEVVGEVAEAVEQGELKIEGEGVDIDDTTPAGTSQMEDVGYGVEDTTEEQDDATETIDTSLAKGLADALDEVVSTRQKGNLMGNKQCRWSWSRRRCEPTDICRYKYKFLDATIGESCRLKEEHRGRHVFSNPDVMAPPALVLGSAGALFAADLAAIRFTPLLQKFPLLFNAVQGFVLFVSGDTLFQVLEQGWEKKVGVKFWRMVRSGLIGLLNNGVIHYAYYKWIDKHFPYSAFPQKRWGPPEGAPYKLVIGFTKWAVEWPTMGIYKIGSMYFLTALLSGSLDGLGQKFKESFMLTWLRSLQVWPIYDMLLYAYVPTAHRPLFNSFMSIAWGGYLSHVSQPDTAEGVRGDDLLPKATA